MADTIRTRAALEALLADNTAEDISAQDLRDVLISVHLMSDLDQVVTVAKAGGQYTSIRNAVNSISDAASNKIYTVLVYPGEYEDTVALSNYVNIVAIDPKATKLNGVIGDENAECHCYLNFTIEHSSSQELMCIRNSNSVINFVGNISNLTTGIAVWIQGGIVTITGNIYSYSGSGVYAEGGMITINGDIQSDFSVALNIYNGIAKAQGKITSLWNNAEGYGIRLFGSGTIILQNSKIICTYADAKSIYAPNAKNAYCMNVWANRDDSADITQMIAGGFNFDANVQ